MSQSNNNKSTNQIPKPPEYEKRLPENIPGGISNQKTPKPHLNKPVSCPWTPTAPSASTSNQRIGPACFSGAYVLKERNVKNNCFTSNVFVNKCAEDHGASSTQFFHFLRLMQLFPDVHPATIHAVMALSNNDFFATVDKLLYAKRCKDLALQQQQLLVSNNNARARYQPYSFKPNYINNVKFVTRIPEISKNSGLTNSCQPLNSTQGQTTWDTNLPSRPLDAKRLVYKNKSKGKESKVGAKSEAVATPQIEIPITPLSPNPDAP